ncbi:MAG: hypothetical protein PHW52_03635 [Candidatus Pacebacteria bacterium]|nr:hypothetical protein [Candidatus Paceibacterota bacterium]
MNKKIIYLFLLIVLCGCLILIQSAHSPEDKSKVSSDANQQSLPKCSEESYGLDCSIVNFLKENLGRNNKSEAKVFCYYNKIGEKDNEIYLRASCGSFRIISSEMVCPDEKTNDECFITKKCGYCTEKGIEPRIIQDAGVVIPVKLTRTDDGYKMETPSDGSLYQKSMERIFPAEILEKIVADTSDIFSMTIKLAENEMKTKAYFEVKKITETSCQGDSDCPEINEGNRVEADCPLKMNCVDKKCTIGCYDLIDRLSLPRVEK